MQKRSSIAIFKSSIFALFLMELYGQVGTKKSGYFWMFFDVLFVVIIFVGAKGYFGDFNIHGLESIVFLAVNLMAFFFFRTTVQSLLGVFVSSKKLFDYQQIKPIDIFISKFIFGLLVRIIATFILIFIGLYFGFDLEVKNFNLVILSISWLIVFTFGIALFSAVFSHFFNFYKKIVGFLMFPLLFGSAVFYTVGTLPQYIRDILLYNPLVHFMEMLHGNFFYVLDTQYIDYIYMIYWTVIPLFLGLFFYTRAEKGIISS